MESFILWPWKVTVNWPLVVEVKLLWPWPLTSGFATVIDPYSCPLQCPDEWIRLYPYEHHSIHPKFLVEIDPNKFGMQSYLFSLKTKITIPPFPLLFHSPLSRKLSSKILFHINWETFIRWSCYMYSCYNLSQKMTVYVIHLSSQCYIISTLDPFLLTRTCTENNP